MGGPANAAGRRNANCGPHFRFFTLAAAVAMLCGAQGCASVGRYFENRYHDFTRCIDLGVTVSSKPYIGLYWNSLELITIGYSHVDGHFVGFGGGQIGITRMYNNCWAIGYGQETIGWGPLLDTDRREEAIVRRRSGALGIVSGIVDQFVEFDPTGDGYEIGPDYTPACVHFVPHLGYIGIAWNARYSEILQFGVGWFGLDLTGHGGDRHPVGKWPFPERHERAPEPAPAPDPGTATEEHPRG